jgi:hypothetical protein
MDKTAFPFGPEHAVQPVEARWFIVELKSYLAGQNGNCLGCMSVALVEQAAMHCLSAADV